MDPNISFIAEIRTISRKGGKSCASGRGEANLITTLPQRPMLPAPC